MEKIKKVRYSGILSKARLAQNRPYRGLLLESQAEAEARTKGKKDDLERLLALFEHYEIDPMAEGADLRLVLALAHQHVQGFKVIDKPSLQSGRPAEWSELQEIELLADVWTKEAEGKSASQACAILVKEMPSEPNKKKPTGPSLYRRYQKVKKMIFSDIWAGPSIGDIKKFKARVVRLRAVEKNGVRLLPSVRR